MPWTEYSLNPTGDSTESFWLKEAKAALRTRDPVAACVQVDAADKALCGIIEDLCGRFRVRRRWLDRACFCKPEKAQARGRKTGLNRTKKCSNAETLARWADRHCRDILWASRAEEQKLFNSGYWDDD